MSKLNTLKSPFPIALTVLSLFSLILVAPAMAQEKLLRTLTVTGQGIENIPTTLTRVELGVEVRSVTAVEVQQEVAKKTSAVVELLRSRQVEQLQTTGVVLQPNYDYSNNQNKLIGYIGVNTISFRLPSEQIGNLLDETVRVGATRIDGVSFTATPEAISLAQQEALRKATLDAQALANAVLKTLNLTSQEVVSIQINGANVPLPQMVQTEQLAKGNADISTPLIGGEQTVEASVTLQISY